MKTTAILKRSEMRPVLTFLTLLVSIILITSSSCQVGADGHPGSAYVTFEWEVEKPEFIDCGTTAVPPNFYYGTYYRISPGWYTAYYEGKVWTGTAYGTYAWEMDYEIWVNPGQRGGYGYNGKDGANTYMNFVCTPYGPKVYRHESYMRKAPEIEDYDQLKADIAPSEGVFEYQTEDFSIKVNYRKVTPRSIEPGAGNIPLN